MNTHEIYLEAVRGIAVKYATLPPKQLERLKTVKIVYGSGRQGTRGVCWHGRWHRDALEPLVEISAFGETHHWQLAGTLIHELAHAIAGYEAAHGREWKRTCELLGLRCAKASGHTYLPAYFAPAVRYDLGALAAPSDGFPVSKGTGGCKVAVGSKGGKSTGPGSGRLRLWICECSPPVRLRAATDTLKVHCDTCGHSFKRG